MPLQDQLIDQIIQETLSQGWSFQGQVLTSSALQSINAFFDEHRDSFVPAMVGKGEGLQRREEIRGDYTYWLDPLNLPSVFKPCFEILEPLKLRLNRELFLGIKDFEGHLAFYPAGTFYRKHSDRHESQSSRIFSFIFYLHQDWKKDEGGELLLYQKDGSLLKEITPTSGGFMCFLSEDFPHEVKAATRERRSLTGWMHTKILS